MAIAAARSSGIPVDDVAAKEHIKMSESQWSGFQEIMLERYDVGGLVDAPTYSLLAMAAERYPANNVTDRWLRTSPISSATMAPGGWAASRARRWRTASSGRTALSMRALQLYSLPARQAEFEPAHRSLARLVAEGETRYQ